MPFRGRIVATSSYLPERILTNDDLSLMVDTTDEWIFSRTGIRERRIARPDESTADMVTLAVESLIVKSGVDASSIDLFIVATTTPDFVFPSVACVVHGRLGMSAIPAFDISAACSGFVYAMSVANVFIAAGKAKNVIVVGADKMSAVTDWKDRSTCILFGDGAAAVLLQSIDFSDTDTVSPGIIDLKIYSDGALCDLLKTSGGLSSTNTFGTVIMNGREVFRNAIINMADSTAAILSDNGLSISDVDLVIPHQANVRIIEGTLERLGLPLDKAIITVDIHGNTSAASIPLALDVAIKTNRIKSGDLVVMHAVGSGLTWGCGLVRF